ncbi:type VI secretion system baseplate subunit TssE [uncultured Cohaesibacter sp.]|uniref:type VI secretion system baseplate subunit TssE n=1 Tax=uncultured Cohaesibacter sp. TaxID=1002546 RepID=UPI0029C96132|nr:type VI secretion system baseplate subunit TssE [uncultured Cohaesibacter sp.]
MITVSLLQKLEQVRPEQTSRQIQYDDSEIMESILHDLRILLNSRRGNCETRPEFGLADFNATENATNSVAMIARDVQRQIVMFEPRLRNVSVRPVQDEERRLEYVFHISAELNRDGDAIRVTFDSIMGADGSMRFNG